jgi:hypothetical protein
VENGGRHGVISPEFRDRARLEIFILNPATPSANRDEQPTAGA